PEGGQRPDLVVHLAGDRHVIVDAKVALAAYLDAAQTDDPAVRAERLGAHARQLRAHVDQLGAKTYWERTNSPEFVVLFIPGEAFLAPALEADPELMEHAARKRVVLATPTTLIALLRTVAYAWQQERLTEHAAEVFELGRDLYSRLATLGGHVDRLGRSLASSVTAFNATVGSLEGRVLPTARRLASLGIVATALDSPGSVEALPRPLTAPELIEQAASTGPSP
ncbi:MAG: DNA recombination protein RmuC, partial [Mycobacteriales bacterium]